MTRDGGTDTGTRIIGRLLSAEGAGVVRIEDRYETTIDDLWEALTDPGRLARWYGEVEGALRPGGEFRTYLAAADIESTGRVELCEPPRRLRVTTRETEESHERGQGVPPHDATIEATLASGGEGTALVIEIHGMPLHKIAFYGVGWQIHVERLEAHLAGRECGDTEARWGELVPAYQQLAAAFVLGLSCASAAKAAPEPVPSGAASRSGCR